MPLHRAAAHDAPVSSTLFSSVKTAEKLHCWRIKINEILHVRKYSFVYRFLLNIPENHRAFPEILDCES